MKKKKKVVSMEVMVIVHGRSEYVLCKNIMSNLRLKHEIIARDKGASSIQITSVMQTLNDRRFISFNSFTEKFCDVECSKNKLKNFSLFIIMDVDDCTPIERASFVSKSMFKDHWLYNYIVPIYNDPNLESTMKAATIEVRQKKNYIDVFPINTGPLNIDEAQRFHDKIKNCSCSNMSTYVNHCILISKNNRV